MRTVVTTSPGIAESGFSLIEMLLVLVLTLLVAGAGVHLMVSSTVLAQAPPEALDLQQRARSALGLLGADLMLAGAGADVGPFPGSLAAFLPALVPHRAGRVGSDPPAAARDDAVSVLFVPEGGAAAVLSAPVSGATPTAFVDPSPGCPLTSSACGITAGVTVLIADGTGRFGVYLVTDAIGRAVVLKALQGISPAFGAGALVVPVEAKVFAFDGAARQLRMYDQDGSDVPVIDDVVALRFEYLGDASPPTRPRPGIGEANCLYDAAGAQLPSLVTLPAVTGSWAPLPLTLFQDGPWCGEGDRRFDADLLRVRAVRVTLRLQVGAEVFRSAAVFSLDGGTDHQSATAIPDLLLAAQFTPRNLNAGR